ncbi:MAG TPA: hypothetical protein VGA37_04765 [Gemmatimonadales bacterium]
MHASTDATHAERKYRPPDFAALGLHSAPDARFEAVEARGVLPDGFFSTTNLPTYVRVAGVWRRPRRPRMDCAIVLDAAGELTVLEPRRLEAGMRVAMGEMEDGSRGVYVHADAFLGPQTDASFRFMSTQVSRERPVDYQRLASELRDERERGGHIVWVVGPALVHARARDDLVWMIERGYVGAMLAGNALAVHDLEAALYGTALGVTPTGGQAEHGHGHHVRAINVIQRAGSIAAAVRDGVIREGIMYALVTRGVPFVLAGSVRDDGPVPDVITDAVAAQDAMREQTVRATYAVMIATALHAIAVGNMLPAFVETHTDDLRPLATICVDQTEFVVNKLRDRGTHQAHGVVTNAQDFMHVLRFYLERLDHPAT